MKSHLTWIGVAALAAVALSVQSVEAQYAPYQPQQQPLPQVAGYPATALPTTAQPPAQQSTAVPVAPPAASAATTRYQMPAAPAASYPPVVAQPAAQFPAYAYPQTSYPQTAQAPTYPTHGYTVYPTSAQQPGAANQDGGSLPAPTPAAPVPPTPEHGDAAPSAAAPAGMAPGAPTPAAGGHGAYPSTGYQTGTGYSGYGQASCGYTDYGIAGACEQECDNGHTWFGGVYWLFMERDNPNTRKLTVRVDHDVATDPYYPQANTTVLSTDQSDFGWAPGVEVRLGSTFSIGSACDQGCSNGGGYGNACGCAPPDSYAWEVAWWGLDEEDTRSAYYDVDPLNRIRLYGMVNFAGLEYDLVGDGSDWRPVNQYYGYALPIDDPGAAADGDLIVLGQRTRSYFSCQNLELNFIRFPLCCDSGCGGGGCAGGSSGYDMCGYDACGSQSDCNPIAFSMSGMCGVRYFRIDDDFYYGNQWAVWDTGAYGPSNWLNYDINVDNNLIGPQVGWNMNYCVGCKWNFFWNSTFGIFNNHIESNQRVWGDNGVARNAQTGQTFASNTDKDDISFLGELRLGGSYDVTCNWRAVLAYRAIAMTGIANSVDQIPTDFTNASYPGIIDSDGSIIIHGIQVGAECHY